MRKSVKPLLGLGLFFVAMSTSGAATASVASYSDEAVQALQTKHVYVSPSATRLDSGSLARLESATNGTSIGVVVLPSSAADEVNGDLSQFVTDVSIRTGVDTVVIAFGSDLEAVSTVDPSASDIANKAESNSASVGDALVTFVSEIGTEQSTEPTQKNGAEFSGATTASILALVLLAVGMTTWWRKRRRADASRTMKSVESTTATARIPVQIEERLTNIAKFQPLITDEKMIGTLRATDTDLRYLFNNAPLDDLRSLQSSYVNTLDSVLAVLAKYVDIQNNPKYYEPHTSKLLASGLRAVTAYANSVLEHVRKTKRGELVTYEVEAEYLTSYLQDVYKSKE